MERIFIKRKQKVRVIIVEKDESVLEGLQGILSHCPVSKSHTT